MLIAIAIAEEIQGLQRIASKFCKFWASGCSLTFARSLSFTGLIWGESQWCFRPAFRISNWDLVILGMQATRKPEEGVSSCGTLRQSRFATVQSQTSCQIQGKLRTLKLSELAKLFNPWISSAMAMAMSIYRTLCVLVSWKYHFFLKGFF